jgi:hypothetical protein
MNIDTEEIRSIDTLTEEERRSGRWIPIPVDDPPPHNRTREEARRRRQAERNARKRSA